MELQDLKKSIDLEGFISEYGYQKNKFKSSKNIPVYENGNERLIIRQGNDCKIYYVAGSDEKGTVIDFVKNRPNLLKNCPAKNIFEQIKLFLNQYVGNRAAISHMATDINTETNVSFNADSFFFPKEKNINNTCFSYLKRRNIVQETLTSPVFNNIGLVKNKKNNQIYYNLAFPLFDEDNNIKGIDYRFFDQQGQNHKMFLPGSDKKHAIGISSSIQKNIKEIILVESPIDAMSHYQLRRKGKDDLLYMYFDGTICKEQINTFLNIINSMPSKPSITLGFDNDIQGNLTGQIYTLSILISLLTKDAVPYAFASNQKIKFTIDNKHKDIFSSILKNPEIEHTINENSFSIIFPKDKDIIFKFTQNLSIENVKIEQSVCKDWNDDLRQTNELKNHPSRKL